MVETARICQRAFQSHSQMTPDPGPHHQVQQPQSSPPLPQCHMEKSQQPTPGTKGLQSRLARVTQPGLGPPRSRATAWWGSATDLGTAMGEGHGGSPRPCAARQSTCSRLSRAPFLSVPCPWPEMNKTQEVGGAIHGPENV